MYIIFEKIQKLIDARNQAFTKWENLQNGLQEQLANERITLLVANENRESFKADTNANLARLASEARETLDNFIEIQTKKAGEVLTMSVTADESAQINMLVGLDKVKTEELEFYQEKYSDKPLLLKRLGEVARKHDVYLLFTEEQRQKMEPMEFVREMDSSLSLLIDRNDSIASYPLSIAGTDAIAGQMQTEAYINILNDYKAKAF